MLVSVSAVLVGAPGVRVSATVCVAAAVAVLLQAPSRATSSAVTVVAWPAASNRSACVIDVRTHQIEEAPAGRVPEGPSSAAQLPDDASAGGVLHRALVDGQAVTRVVSARLDAAALRLSLQGAGTVPVLATVRAAVFVRADDEYVAPKLSTPPSATARRPVEVAPDAVCTGVVQVASAGTAVTSVSALTISSAPHKGVRRDRREVLGCDRRGGRDVDDTVTPAFRRGAGSRRGHRGPARCSGRRHPGRRRRRACGTPPRRARGSSAR